MTYPRGMSRTSLLAAGAACVVAALAASVFLWPKDEEAVAVYCATDDVHAQPILDEFTRRTGIRVHASFDTEASKTVGRVNALRIERDHPRADVFWNNEPLHTMRLADEGMFEPYASPSAADVPAEFKDPQARWTGFAARARVLIVNLGQVPNGIIPQSMQDLADPQWRGRAALVKPLTGTTLTHVAALYTVIGREPTLAWIRDLRANECRFPTGNGPLAASVAVGECAFGFTDTDDFRKQQVEGRPVKMVYPDQAGGRPGTLVLPNTVALVKNGPRPDLARKFIDFLLLPEVEERLAASDGAYIPIRAGVPRPGHVQGPPAFRAMKVDWSDVARDYDARMREIQALFTE